jgi:hypothetical protein
MRTPDLNGSTGGFGWPMVNRLAHATAVTRRPSGGKTVSALLPRQRQGCDTRGPPRRRTADSALQQRERSPK